VGFYLLEERHSAQVLQQPRVRGRPHRVLQRRVQAHEAAELHGGQLEQHHEPRRVDGCGAQRQLPPPALALLRRHAQLWCGIAAHRRRPAAGAGAGAVRVVLLVAALQQR
jgi:hypothetical protein